MPIEVNDESLAVEDTEHSGLVPVPMSAQGVTTFRLELANGASCEVIGTGVVIETAVEGTHPEALPDEWAPKDNGPA